VHILHVAKYFPPCPGGIERFVADLSEAQVALGHTVTVVCFAHLEQNDAAETVLIGERLTVIRVRTLLRFAFAPIAPDFFRVLQQTLKRLEPDYLHIHLPNLALMPCLMTSYARDRPWLLHWHADVPSDARSLLVRFGALGYRFMESQALKRARRIIATSKAYADKSPYLKANQERVSVVPLGLSSAPLIRAAREPKHALFIGRFAYYKGLPTLIEALALAPDWRLTLIGDGPEYDAIKALIEARSLAGRVRLLGSVDDAEKELALARASVLCLSSIERTEAFGLVLLEAYRARRAVIASDVAGSGIAEVVVPGQTGWLVRPEDPAALAEALNAAAASDLDQLGLQARARFEQHYRIEQVALEIDQLVASLNFAAAP